MPRKVMKWLAPLLFVLTSLAWPAFGSAQTTTANAISMGLRVFADGREFKNETRVFVGKSQCTSGVNFAFTASGYGMAVPVLELWASSSAGKDCSDAANRSSPNNQPPVCWLVASETNVQPATSTTLKAEAIELFSQDGKACDEVTNLPYYAYLVPLASPTQPGTAMAPPAITGVTILRAVFTLYTQTPKAPTAVSGRSGETTLGISWKKASGADVNTSYRIYYDVGQGEGDAGVECGSGGLVAGQDPKDNDTIDYKVEKTEGGSISGSLVEIGDLVAVGVVTVDGGGNRSALSEIVCIEREQTDGFYDRYERANGNGLEKCSLHAPGKASWSGWGSLTMLALALVARRRRTT